MKAIKNFLTGAALGLAVVLGGLFIAPWYIKLVRWWFTLTGV